jgi:hypothetical protein
MANHSLQTTAFCPWKDYRCNDIYMYGNETVLGVSNINRIILPTGAGTAGQVLTSQGAVLMIFGLLLQRP